MGQPAPVSDYLAGLPEPERAALTEIVSTVRELVPSAAEGESYGMPAFRYKKKPLLGMLAHKEYVSVYPFSPAVVEAVKTRLQGYSLSKGTIRFTAAKPLPDRVIRDMILLRAKEIEASA